MNLSNHCSPAPKPEIPVKESKVKPKRFAPLKKVNRKRQKRLFEENFGGKDYRAYIVSLPCDLCGRRPVDPAHLDSRGSGGKADVLAPLCQPRFLMIGCHRVYDEYRWTIHPDELNRLRRLAAERYKNFHSKEKSA